MRMKALKDFRTKQEGNIQAGQEFTPANAIRANEFEQKGLAFPILETKKAKAAAPLAPKVETTPGSPIGETKPASSSPAGTRRRGRPSKSQKTAPAS